MGMASADTPGVKPTPIPRQRGQNEKNSERNLKLKDHVGFDSLPDQLVNKATSQGFAFNMLCVGETGIGKSTMMDTLFNTHFENTPSSHGEPAVSLKSNTYDLAESNVKLRLTLVDTVGYGDQVNKDDSWKPIVHFIDSHFEEFLQEELKVKRSLSTYHDTRIHACLYFISPTGHSLRSLDLLTMKKLDSKVNIIPVIGKSDVVSRAELEVFKKKIMSELTGNGIQIYQFPTDDEAVSEVNSSMNAQLPFAVIGCNEEIVVNNKKVRARQYPWGIIEIENELHSDFTKLREMLIRTNMEDLRENTHDRHYELYRRDRLKEMGFADGNQNEDGTEMSLSQTFEKRRTDHLQNLQRKEDEMRQMFVQRVKAKEGELKESEKELHVKFEQLKRSHAEEKKSLEEKKRLYEEELQAFQHRREVERASALLRSQQGGGAATLDPHLASGAVHASTSSISVGKSFSSTLKRFTSSKSVDKSPELH